MSEKKSDKDQPSTSKTEDLSHKYSKKHHKSCQSAIVQSSNKSDDNHHGNKDEKNLKEKTKHKEKEDTPIEGNNVDDYKYDDEVEKCDDNDFNEDNSDDKDKSDVEAQSKYIDDAKKQNENNSKILLKSETAPLIEKVDVFKPNLNKVVVVVGSTGTGKSTIINMLYNDSVLKENLNQPCEIGATSNSVTKKMLWIFNARNLTIYADTVGLSDPHQSDSQIASDLKKFIEASKGGVHCIIIVLRYGRITREERINLEIIKNLFDKNWINNCIVVATFFDGDVNSVTQVIDEDAQEKAILGWTHNDADTSALFNKIKGKVILTDNSLGRHEEANRKLRQQCLDKLKLFIESCTDLVSPTSISWLDIIHRLLDKWFSFHQLKAANDRMKKIMEHLVKDYEKEQLQANDCSVCLENVLYNDMIQTKCNHIFHYKCILLAISECGGPCPVCRSPVFQVYSTVGLMS
ncbi:phosphatidylinositol 4-phosphate 5-kinase-like [Hydra vulgaris]|uniref:Phosphatidylinositol 4-phosphate 5-kinase-like n=1 Tax=Hydra vulgaris TaxID=6087 RepID=A0ABM4CBT7_HYDVU